jgi:hypothetical protein
MQLSNQSTQFLVAKPEEPNITNTEPYHHNLPHFTTLTIPGDQVYFYSWESLSTASVV